MQIRIQGRQVQLIRSPYDAAKKRCTQKVAHTFPRQHKYLSADPASYLSAEQVADLSADEHKQLSDWLTAAADKYASEDREFNIRCVDRHIGSAADAIAADGVSETQAAAIWASIEQLARAMRKAGHPKPKPAKPAKPAAAAGPGDGQGSLSLTD